MNNLFALHLGFIVDKMACHVKVFVCILPYVVKPDEVLQSVHMLKNVTQQVFFFPCSTE